MIKPIPLNPDSIFVDADAFPPVKMDPIPLMIGNACRLFLENQKRTIILCSVSETSDDLDIKFVEKDGVFPLTEQLVAQVRQQWLADDELQKRFGGVAASSPYDYTAMTDEQREILRVSEVILSIVQTAGYRNDPHQARTLQMMLSFLFTLHFPDSVVVLFAGDVTHRKLFIRPLRFVDLVKESEVQGILSATGVAADMISGADSLPKDDAELRAEENNRDS